MLPVLTLYTRRGCSLCQQALENLRALDVHVQDVNVDDHPELRQRFGDDVPVLSAGDRVLGRGAFSRARLGTIKLMLLREAAPPITPSPRAP